MRKGVYEGSPWMAWEEGDSIILPDGILGTLVSKIITRRVGKFPIVEYKVLLPNSEILETQSRRGFTEATPINMAKIKKIALDNAK